MEEPANIDRELLRFGSGQEHAEVERVEKTRLTDPAFLLDQLGLHDRDLPGRSAEANEPELEPEAEGFAESRMRDGGRSWLGELRFVRRGWHQVKRRAPRVASRERTMENNL